VTESSEPPYRTRTSVLFARNAPKAVVLRRGPRTHQHLIAWNLDDDTFDHGQWMKGNVRLADLSPAGDKLIYFAEQYHVGARARPTSGPYDPLRQRVGRASAPSRPRRKIPRYLRTSGQHGRGAQPREVKGSWTAISTPPYFSALAIWPSIGRWTGGGVFLADRDILIGERLDGVMPIENVPMPATVRVRSWEQARGRKRSAYAPSTTESAEHASIAQALLASGLKWVDWISLGRGEDALFAGDGRIFCLRRWRNSTQSAYLSRAEQIADFRDLSFQLARAPDAAMQW
jgi:hypothetical protein